jgi:hypothetical protein
MQSSDGEEYRVLLYSFDNGLVVGMLLFVFKLPWSASSSQSMFHCRCDQDHWQIFMREFPSLCIDLL